MYGNYVVWQGNNSSIKLYDMGKTPPTTTEIGQGSRPQIFGNIVVWIDSTLSNNIVKYDISTGTKVQISQGGGTLYQWNRPWIHGNKIVWGGFIYGSPQYANIQVHDIFAGQTTTLTVLGSAVTVYGDKLAYTTYGYDVYMYDLKAGIESYVGHTTSSTVTAIDANYVYYVGSDSVNRYEISSGNTVSYSVCGGPNLLQLSGEKVYMDMNCGGPEYWKVRQLDTRTGVVSVLSIPSGQQWAPAVYEDKVVLSDSGNGVRIFDITSPNEEVYSLNASSNTVNVINPYKGTTVSTMTTGNGPSDAGLSPDGTKLYVLNSSDKTVSIAQTYDFAITTQTILINYGTYTPQAIAGDNDGNAYVALKKNGQNGVIKKLPAGDTITLTGQNPNSIKISPDGKTLFVSVADINSITPIDIASFTPQTNITTGAGTKLIKP